ncbi:MAG: hypothetical protein KM310_10625 [Clostridiales bacterium]|nr:hypothetical protein [Clostridiales bacterium]
MKAYYTEHGRYGPGRLIERPDGWQALEEYLLAHKWLLLRYAEEHFVDKEYGIIYEDDVIKDLLYSIRAMGLGHPALAWFDITVVFDEDGERFYHDISEYEEASLRYSTGPAAIVLDTPLEVRGENGPFYSSWETVKYLKGEEAAR